MISRGIGLVGMLVGAAALTPAAADCDKLYFGIGQAPDYAAAFKCYSLQPVDYGAMLSLMALNGEGTKRDLAQAVNFLAARTKAIGFKDLTDAALDEVLQARQATPKDQSEVPFCMQIAMAPFDLSRCQRAEHAHQQEQILAVVAKLKAALGKDGAAAAEKLRESLAAFQLAEGKLAADGFRGDAIGALVGGDAAQTVGQEFADLVDMAQGKGLLSPPLPPTEVKQAEIDLNAALSRYAASLDKDGKALLNDSQQAWSKYRDAWIPVAKQLWRGSLKEAEAEKVIVTHLNRSRGDDLQGFLSPEG